MLNGKLNLAILISGGGTTMLSVLLAIKSFLLFHVNLALIIASKPDAGGIKKALAENFPNKYIKVIVRKNFPTREAFGEAINREILSHGIDLVAQLGWTPFTPENVIEACGDMIFNQHPGPLDSGYPDFGGRGMHGLAVHHAVLEFAKKINRPFWTEATVHRVTKELDRGAILGRCPVQLMRGDDARALAARVLPYEHKLVISTLVAFSEFGGAREMNCRSRLIRPEEIDILNEAKAAAVAAFPNG